MSLIFSDRDAVLRTISQGTASFPQFLLNCLEMKSTKSKSEASAIQMAITKRSMTLQELEDEIKLIGVEKRSKILGMFGSKEKKIGLNFRFHHFSPVNAN